MQEVEVIQVDREKEYERWLEVRTSGIGGSDAAAILGESNYKSAYTLWAEKSGVSEPDRAENPAMRWGHALERPTAQMFAEDYNIAVVYWPVILRSRAHPVLLANVDFFIVTPSNRFPIGQVTDWSAGAVPPPGIQCLLEVKTTGIAAYGNAEAWDDENVPVGYMIQGRHYYAVTGINNVVFAACVAGRGLVVRAIEYTEYDRQFHIEQMHKFWNCVASGTPPDPDGSKSTLETIKRVFPTSEPNVIVEADDFVATTFERYVKAVDAAKEAEALKNELKAKLALAIGKGEEMVYQGRSLFTYKNARKFNAERFTKEHPELVPVFASFDPALLKSLNPALYDEYMIDGEGSRSLKLKGES